MLSKVIHILVFILFIAFAAVQYNDSDATRWIILYLMVAILPLLRIFGKSVKIYGGFLVGLFFAFFITKFSLLSEWLAAGKPAFIDYEPTNVKEVEGIREFLGICICFITALLYSLLKKERPQ